MDKKIQSPLNEYNVVSFDNGFAGKDLVSIDQFTKASQVEKVFTIAKQMEQIVKSKKTSKILVNSTMVELFYQPSTRTFTSFLAAARWLGCSRTIAIQGMEQYSSVVKGETLRDTMKSIEQTTACDIVVLRHPEDNSGYEAAYFAGVPIVNGGSGKLEHPTQALLDLYTIKHRLGRVKGLKVGMLGDLLNGRTVKSLGKLLTLVDPKAELCMISPKVLAMPQRELETYKSRGAKVVETTDLLSVIGELDVLYVTRVQKEWFKTPAEIKLYESLKGQYDITPQVMKQAKKEMIVMHPLPRVGEIAYEVDSDPRCAYFEQMRMGLYTRMAILGLLTGRIK